MYKITRAITVLAASAALTLTGVGPASAQSSGLDGLDSLSSWIGEPESHRAERELRDAATRWAQHTTNSNYGTIDHAAREAELPRTWHSSPVEGTRVNSYDHAGTHHRFYQVEVKKYRNMVNDFHNSDELHGFRNGDYGVHTTVHGDHVYITIAFRH